MSSDSATTTTETETNRSIHHTDLTAIQIDLLVVTARLETSLENVHGLAIKESLGDIHGEEVNRGRLYPNLDKLAEMGIVEKEAQSIDARTNSYRVTVEGFRLLDARRIHIEGALARGCVMSDLESAPVQVVDADPYDETRMRGNRPVETGDTEFAAARLPPGDDADGAVVAGSATSQPAHEVLHIQPNAPDGVVESAARARKAQTHPDNDGSTEEFQKVVAAEEAMLDE